MKVVGVERREQVPIKHDPIVSSPEKERSMDVAAEIARLTKQACPSDPIGAIRQMYDQAEAEMLKDQGNREKVYRAATILKARILIETEKE